MLDDNVFKTNFVGVKNISFTILRDETPQTNPSPAAKVQPKEHEWKTPVCS